MKRGQRVELTPLAIKNGIKTGKMNGSGIYINKTRGGMILILDDNMNTIQPYHPTFWRAVQEKEGRDV